MIVSSNSNGKKTRNMRNNTTYNLNGTDSASKTYTDTNWPTNTINVNEKLLAPG